MHRPRRTRDRSASTVYAIEPLEHRRMLSGRVVGYFPEYRWSFFDKIDWSAITHLNYFSIAANSNGVLSTNNINLSHLDTAVSTAHGHGDTISIVVGPHSFTTLASSPAATTTFVNNVVQFALAHDLDGIDIDWEPRPTGSAITAFGSLIDALYAQTSQHDLMISAAVFPNHTHIPLAAALKLDWINIMGYNYSYANHTTYQDSINSLNLWSNYGVPREKLLLGIPFYGRQGTSWSQTATRIYDQIMDTHFLANGVYPDPDADFVDGWYFNGMNTVRDKCLFVSNNGYGGVMIWELGQDHIDSSGNFGQRALLPVIKSIITDPTPPTVVSSEFHYAIAPHRLSFTFSEDVGDSIGLADLTVRNAATQASIIVTGVEWDPASYTATYTLNNVLADGNYRATLSGGGVSDPGGNSIGEDHVLDFSFLNGDANGDGTVNLTDFNILAANFGKSPRNFTQGDFSYDGQVNLDDFNLLAARFGASTGAAAASSSSLGRQPTGAVGPRPARVADSLREDVLA